MRDPESNVGVISMGIKAPVIKEGDDIVGIVTDSVLKATTKYYSYPYHEQTFYDIDDNDVIGVTESVVARATGNYVTVDEIAEEIKRRFNNPDTIVLNKPIYSRNRFSMILKAVARAASKRVVIIMPDYDEVGNPCGVNPWTGVDIEKYYFDIIQKEGCLAEFQKVDQLPYDTYSLPFDEDGTLIIHCGLHDYETWKPYYNYDNAITLADICDDKCDWGLLGSNKATEEKLKLFPKKEVAQKIVDEIQKRIFDETKKHVHVMCYGDGGFKDPVALIWECADPVICPAFTKGLEGSPNEIKLKAFADDMFADLTGDELTKAIKESIRNKDKQLKGNMDSQGTTPRRYVDLLGSLMDLTSGSGDKGTPIILVKNYFRNFAN